MQLLLLSKGHPELALWEVKQLLGVSDYEQEEDKLLLPLSFQEKQHHLAYTKRFLQVLFFAKEDVFLQQLSNLELGEQLNGSYAVRVPGNRKLEKAIADVLHEMLPHRVDLRNPDTLLEAYTFKDQLYFGEVIEKKDQQFAARKSHNRPSPHPSSLDPRLARCMVHLLGDVDEVVDPFCGSGGLLLEAGLTGHAVVGYDLDPIMIKRAQQNCEHYGVSAKLSVKDATTLKTIPALVTDLPYGRNTKATDLEHLYLSFFKNVKIGKGVVGFPDVVDGKQILTACGYIVEKEFTYYLHKTLSKNILLFS